MTDTDRIADRLALVALNDGFAYSLDHGDLGAFLALFTPDVEYRSGPRHFADHAALRGFFETRAATGRLSRHSYSGLRLRFTGEDRAEGASLWVTWGGQGPAPVEGTAPAVVADVTDIYRRDAGVWRIAARQIVPVFLPAPQPVAS